MASIARVLRIEVYDLSGKANGARLQARLTANGTAVQTDRVLTTSLWGKLFEDVQWYLDDYIYSDAFAVERASVVERDINNACRRVAVDLELDHILSQIESDHVELQIVNHAKDLYELAFAFPWETLEHTDIWSASRKSVTVSRLISNDLSNLASGTHADQTNINILLVLARVADTNDGRPRDIPPFVALEAITQLSDRLAGSVQLSIEVARPGTWLSVKECLARHPPGHFSLVHFDVHGGTRAKSPSLSFADPDGTGRLKKEFVATVARSLQKAEIRNVVLNACGSASNAHGAEANPAHIFLQHGIEAVVGMSHRASAQAMSLFLRSFYEKLVASSSFSAATAIGRRVLSDAKARSTNQQVDRDICDYILPVLYTSRDHSLTLTSTSLEVDDPPMMAPSLRNFYLEGRDFDILQLEKAIRSCSILCVVGAAGVGKSTLLHRATDIWERTGLFASCRYVDLQEQNVTSLEDLSQITDLTGSLGTSLMVIDNVQNAVALGSVEAKRRLPKSEWERIQNYLAKQAKCKYIIVTRTKKTVCSSLLEKAHVFYLKGLHPLDSLALFRREIGSSAAQWSAEDRLSAELLLELLQYNPIAIHLMIPWISSSKLGIHDFFNALFDWNIDSENSPYWIALARAQFHLPILADMTRCFLRLDMCGQYMWLWIALYWNHGSGVVSTSDWISQMTFGAPGTASVAHALGLGEEHGLFITDGEPCFIRGISPIFTIWMRYGLFHGLRVLRSDPSEYQGDMLHAMMATGNLRTMMGSGNPLRVTYSDPMASVVSAETQEQMKQSQGHLKTFWTGDFSDALCSFKDTSDAELKVSRTREMKFNFLAAFNSLMGSPVVLKLKKMQFVELRLFWMLLQQVSSPHENLIYSRRILMLMQHFTSHMDISELEDFRIESALGLLALPVQKVLCTLQGAAPIHKEMLNLAMSIFEACKARFGANVPHIIAAYEPLMQISFQSMRSHEDDAIAHPSIQDIKPAVAQMFEMLGKSDLAKAPQTKQYMGRWLAWLDELSANGGVGPGGVEGLRDRFDSIGASLPIPFDNPFVSFSKDLQDEKETLRWSDHLADALHNGDPVRATRLLKPMIQEAMKDHDWDKARKLLDMFWKLRDDHTSLSQADLQDFLDLDAVTHFEWSLEQYMTKDAPPDGLRSAHANLQKVHSLYKDIANGSASEKQKTAAQHMDKIVQSMFPKSNDKDGGASNDTEKLLPHDTRKFLRAAQKDPWADKVVSQHIPMLDTLDQYEKAQRDGQLLLEQGDFDGARQKLRVATESLLEMGRRREESLPHHYRHVDIPEAIRLKASQLQTLTAYGVGATGNAFLKASKEVSQGPLFSRRDLEPALATFQEAVQVADELQELSLSEQPIGLGASIRLARSYCLELEIWAEVMDGDLGVALRKCGQLMNLLTAVDQHLSRIDPKKISWYHDVRARLGAHHHAWEWRRLTNAFQPHHAALQLKRISYYYGEMDLDGPTDDSAVFFSVGVTMSMVTGKQLALQKALGSKIGKMFWQYCRSSLDIVRDDLFRSFDLLHVIYAQGLMEVVSADVD